MTTNFTRFSNNQKERYTELGQVMRNPAGIGSVALTDLFRQVKLGDSHPRQVTVTPQRE